MITDPLLIAIWNRAAMQDGGPKPQAGDSALADALLADGLIVNGGVLHCFEVLGPRRFAAASAGFRYLGLAEVADFLDAVPSIDLVAIDDDTEQQLDARYWSIVEGDVIEDAFERRFTEAPEDFSR